MNNLKIGGSLDLIKRIAPSRENKKIANNPAASNPFGLSFKGKVITADIFETAAKPSIKENIAQKGKMAASAVVGSLIDFKSTAIQKLEPVIEFGKRVKAHANEIADKINKFDLTQFKIPSLSSKPKEEVGSISKGAKKLLDSGKTEHELGEMLEAEIAAIAA